MTAGRITAVLAAFGCVLSLAAACSDDDNTGSPPGSDGSAASGGSSGTAGSAGSGATAGSGAAGTGGTSSSGGASGSGGSGGSSGSADSGGSGGSGGGFPCAVNTDCVLAYRAGLCCGECQSAISRAFVDSDPCYCVNGESCNPPASCQEANCDGGCTTVDCTGYTGAECVDGRCSAIPPGSGGADCCSPDPPADGAACTGTCATRSCSWMRCAEEGDVTATCTTGGTWSVATTACESIPCGDTSCSEDQICIEYVSGQFTTGCEPNPCGSGPITCECGDTICGGTCASTTGRTIRCDSCPGGICP